MKIQPQWVLMPGKQTNVNGVMARTPVLCVVDYGLEFQVLKRLVMFLWICCTS